jgi:3-deoxy-D-manno-octulosonic-acid transferase
VKYEFWHHYIHALHKRKIPIYLVSGIFRKDQVFFKPHGSFFREMLRMFTFLFVQNNESKQLLESIGIKTIMVTGDTRFDRVYEISKNRKNFELIEAFKGVQLLVVAGSTWRPDEEILFRYLTKSEMTAKFIIVPHEIDPSNIERIVRLSDKVTVKYSEADQTTAKNADMMIIDNIGMLSSLYAYADIAYIGGGFGKGIHNTLEAAVYGIPIIFGPRYEKFDEAKELIKRGAAFSVSGNEEFTSIVKRLTEDESYRKAAGAKALEYVNENLGATEKTLINC